RNNWLLVKRRDAASNGSGDSLLATDKSVASGRTMALIAAGKGRRPKPFMLAGTAPLSADATWQSNRGQPDDAPPLDRRKPRVQPTKRSKMPSFVEPQLCTLLEHPPAEAGWGHEVKFDGYRMQARVDGGTSALRTRKGLDWTGKF